MSLKQNMPLKVYADDGKLWNSEEKVGRIFGVDVIEGTVEV